MNRAKLFILAILGACSIGVVGTLATPSVVFAGNQNSVALCGPNTSGDCQNFVDKYLNPAVSLLTVIVGVIAAISIVVAGIQYASAGSDPGKVQKAKERIGQTLLGLLAYILLFSFLNYLIPGGLF